MIKLTNKLLNILNEAEFKKTSSRVPSAIKQFIAPEFKKNMIGISDKSLSSSVSEVWSFLRKASGEKDINKQIKLLNSANDEMQFLIKDFGKVKDLSSSDRTKMNILIRDYIRGIKVISDLL